MLSEPRREGSVPSSTMLTPGAAIRSPIAPAERRGLLAVEVALQAVADRLVQQDAGPARPEDHGHLAGRRVDRVQVHQRLAQRLVDRALPGLRAQVLAELDPAAGAEAARLQPAVPLDDDRDVEADQRADVGDAVGVGADDLHHPPLAGERDRDLADARVLAPGVGVDGGQHRHLLGEGHGGQRVVAGIERGVGRRRRHGEDAVMPGQGRAHGGSRLAQRLLAEAGAVGVAGGFAGDGAQAEALRGVEAGALQPAVVEGEALRLPVLEVELAVVGAGQSLLDQLAGAGAVEPALGVEQAVGRQDVAHGPSVLMRRLSPVIWAVRCRRIDRRGFIAGRISRFTPCGKSVTASRFGRTIGERRGREAANGDEGRHGGRILAGRDQAGPRRASSARASARPARPCS